METGVLPEKISGANSRNRRSAAAGTKSVSSKTLDALAEELGQEQMEMECGLRKQLIEIEVRLREDRYEKGRILSGYRDLYKPIGKWYDFCRAIGCKERTALNIIADYVAAKGLPEAIRKAASARNIDIASKKQRPLLMKLMESDVNKSDDAESLLQSAIDDLKQKVNKNATVVSAEERSAQAFSAIDRIYGKVNPNDRNRELPDLFTKISRYYSLPRSATSTKIKPVCAGQQPLAMFAVGAA